MKPYVVYHILKFMIFQLREEEEFTMPCRVILSKGLGTTYHIKFGEKNLKAVRDVFNDLFDFDGAKDFIKPEMSISGTNPAFYDYYAIRPSFYSFMDNPEQEFINNDHYQVDIKISGMRYNKINGEINPLWDLSVVRHRETNRFLWDYVDSDTV